MPKSSPALSSATKTRSPGPRPTQWPSGSRAWVVDELADALGTDPDPCLHAMIPKLREAATTTLRARLWLMCRGRSSGRTLPKGEKFDGAIELWNAVREKKNPIAHRTLTGLNLIEMFSNYAPGPDGELLSGLDNPAILQVWGELEPLLDHLAVLAERYGLDSTPLRDAWGTTNPQEFCELNRLVRRLEVRQQSLDADGRDAWRILRQEQESASPDMMKSAGAPTDGVGKDVTLDDLDEAILQEMAKKPEHRFGLTELEVADQVGSRKTIRKRLPHLAELGLISWDPNKRKSIKIMPDGSSLVKRLSTKTTH